MKHETAALDKEGTNLDIYEYSEDVYAKNLRIAIGQVCDRKFIGKTRKKHLATKRDLSTEKLR